jgi:hypothetical protein
MVSAVGGCDDLKGTNIAISVNKTISPVLIIDPASFSGLNPGDGISDSNFLIGDPSTIDQNEIDQLEEAYVLEITLQIEADSPIQNFNWLTSASVFVAAAGSDQNIASISLVPNNANTLSLTVNTEVNIVTLLTSGPLQLSWDVTGVVPNDIVKIGGSYKIRVVGDPF